MCDPRRASSVCGLGREEALPWGALSVSNFSLNLEEAQEERNDPGESVMY